MASGAGEKTKLLDWTEATAGAKDDQTCTAWQLSANGQTTSFGLEVPQVFSALDSTKIFKLIKTRPKSLE